MIWDDDEESDDSLGANKNYVIKEEGKNIPLDDFNDEEGEENSVEEEDEEDNSSFYEKNQEIIKEVLQMVENYLLYGDKHDSNIFE